MQIRDLEIKTGLDRATIRFYEKEGLIKPVRKENGYRDYTPENLDQLLKIKLLRQLGMSLDRIKALQQGSADLQTVLSQQIEILSHRIKEAEQARNVCIQMRIDCVTYGNLDVNYYLNCLNTQQTVPKVRNFQESVPREYHPLRRFLARWLIDNSILNVLLRFVLIVVLRIRPVPDWLLTLCDYVSLFLMLPLQALMLHLWGTTPGKWCMGLRVESENGGKLTFHQALEREWNVLRYGYGFHIPLWTIWRMYKSYREYQEREMDWDWNAEYQYKDVSKTRYAAAVILFAAILGLSVMNANSMMLPRYRGELTISEFSANYNHYLQVIQDDHSRENRLQPDGTFYPGPANSVTIYIDGNPEKEHYSFDYITEGEKLTQIRYTNSWSDVTYITPVVHQCKIAAITAVMSQDGMDKEDLIEFAALMDMQLSEHAEVEYEGVKITWTSEANECSFISGHYIADTDAVSPSVSCEFVIEFP